VDAQNPGQAPATDDQDLANVLAGISQDPAAASDDKSTSDSGLQFEETPAPEGEKPADEPTPESPEVEVPEIVLPTPAAADASAAGPANMTPELEGLKKEALSELRPLVDKLSLPADEKFDTLLLIIRSTDDQSLLGDAHEAAKLIEDETKRAAALLDVIKEIDYFANQPK
jgi:hypothetical protein